MKYLFILCCCCVFVWSDLKVQIVADTNRDGMVEFVEDEAAKDIWTSQRGAIFMFNNDNDLGSRPDCEDDVVNGSQDLADLALMLLHSIPELHDSAKITLSVDSASLNKVNVFYKDNDEYHKVSLENQANIPAKILQNNNLELRIEAKSYADKSWSGIANITVTVAQNNDYLSDRVCLKVAPFLLAANTLTTEVLYIRSYPGKNEQMISQLREITQQADIKLQIVPAEGFPYYQIWLQDCMEIGYSETPQQQMNVVFPANRNRALDNFAEQSLLGANFGWFRYSQYRPAYGKGGSGNGWLDWYGNLEVSPPVPGYPLGRIYYGSNGTASMNPEIVEMLNAQEIQGPAVKLDTGWLLIKHVDETLSFIPSGDPQHPYKALVPDTALTFQLLQQWKNQGKGDMPLLKNFYNNMTVNSLLNNQKLVYDNENLQKNRISENYRIIMNEFQLREQDLIRIPAIIEDGKSVIPNMVNSVYLNGHLVMADPDGPKVNGKDLLQEYIREQLRDLPVKVHFVNDHQYHIWSGNVHCATNTKRQSFPQKWWNTK